MEKLLQDFQICVQNKDENEFFNLIFRKVRADNIDTYRDISHRYSCGLFLYLDSRRAY